MSRTDLRGVVVLGLALTFGIVAKVQAADTFTVPAVQTAYIRPDGPQQGTNAERYLDVEGKNAGNHACYGVLLFEGKNLKSDLDAKYGAGKYRITGLTLELTQSNAKFTKDGSVLIYLSQDTSVDVSTLKYPYDPKVGPRRGAPIATVKFLKSSETDDKNADNAAAKEKGGQTAPTSSTQAGGDKTATASATAKTDAYDLMKGTVGQSLANALVQGRAATIILMEGDPDVAATWAGMKPVGMRKAPTLIVKAIAR